MMNPFSWLQMTNMISYQGLVRTFPRLKRCRSAKKQAIWLRKKACHATKSTDVFFINNLIISVATSFPKTPLDQI
ncbi:hypothetical protein, partial [Aeromonas caviae]